MLWGDCHGHFNLRVSLSVSAERVRQVWVGLCQRLTVSIMLGSVRECRNLLHGSRYGDVKGCERGVWVLLKVRLCNVRVSVRSLVEKPRWLVIS